MNIDPISPGNIETFADGKLPDEAADNKNLKGKIFAEKSTLNKQVEKESIGDTGDDLFDGDENAVLKPFLGVAEEDESDASTPAKNVAKYKDPPDLTTGVYGYGMEDATTDPEDDT